MIRKTIFALIAAGALVLSAAGSASSPTAPPGNGGAGVQQGADNPLTTSFKHTGRVGVTVDALPYTGVSDPSGTFTISGIPTGATIVNALLYLTDWTTDGPVSGTFESVPFGPTPPLTVDPGGGLNLGVHRVDVTALVTGNGSYDYTSSGIGLAYGSALVVVYSDSSLRANTVWINDGAESMCCGTTAATAFTTIQGAGIQRRTGAGKLYIFTQADNNGSGETGEVIYFNGEAVGGPIDANLGNYASLFNINLGKVGQANTAEINTPSDWFGWHLAILSKRRQ